MSNQQQVFRRIVTGHDADNKSIILSDTPPPRMFMVGGPKGAAFYEVWNTLQTPALISTEPAEPAETGLVLGPPTNGTRIRVIDFPPETDQIKNLSSEEAREHFKTMQGESASNAGGHAPHPLMHRTQTVDYGLVLEGEIRMILDKSEINLKAGDIIIQNGTNHAWANRSGSRCRMAFILINGKFSNEFTNH